MVNPMVERATSDMLLGPDWGMNLEISDICNHDLSQVKDVVKGIKKRFGSRNANVQLLALSLLETMVKNCGDVVHMHVAEKNLLRKMVKIVKKKPDFRVKEKILFLIDTWQEAFGGAGARYPQYYTAYHELLRMGVVFPQRSERSTPVFTTQQTQPRKSYKHPHNQAIGHEASESSAEDEFPTLSLTEIQNARGIMDILTDMLTAIDPEKKEGLTEDSIVDLVEQCRTYKRRVVHLVNSTSDESLLRQGLTLNDDLHEVLAKHEALLSGASVLSEKSKPETSQAFDALLIDTGDSKQPGSTPDSSAEAHLHFNGSSATPENVNPKFDLLSFEDFDSPNAENSLAIVTSDEPQPGTPVNSDMFSQNSNVPIGQPYSSSPESQQPQSFPPEPSFYSNGSVPNTVPPEYEQGSDPAWNGHIPQQHQQPSPVYGGQTSRGLPPPPWEVQSADDDQSGGLHEFSQPQESQTTTITNDQTTGVYTHQPITGNHVSPLNNQFQETHARGMLQPDQMAYMYPQQMANPMYTNQAHGYGYGYSHGYDHGQNGHFIDEQMMGLSVRDDTVYDGPSMANASYVHVPSGKPSKPEDKLFGDLVDFAKVKPNKTAPGES